MAGRLVFKVSILNAKRLIYSGEATNLILVGDETEYELLAYHSPLIGVLKKGEVIMDNQFAIPIEKGIVKFFENECIIIAEEKIVEEVKVA